jgi:hypothetical protein
MKIIEVKVKQSGEIVPLIEKSSEEGVPILVRNNNQFKNMIKIAKVWKLKTPDPVIKDIYI